MTSRVFLALVITLAIVHVQPCMAGAEEMAEDEITDDEEPELSLQESLARWGIPNADGSRVVMMPSEFADFSIADVYGGNQFLYTIGDWDALPFDAVVINRLTGGDHYSFEFGGIDFANNALIIRSDPDDHVILIGLVDGRAIYNPLARQERLRLVTTLSGLAVLCVLFALVTGVAWFGLSVMRLISRRRLLEARD
jgi:hypothetical protein